MEMDFHQYIKGLEARQPGSVVRIAKEVGLEFEIPAMLANMEQRDTRC